MSLMVSVVAACPGAAIGLSEDSPAKSGLQGGGCGIPSEYVPEQRPQGTKPMPPLRGRYRAGLALRQQSPTNRRRHRTNQRKAAERRLVSKSAPLWSSHRCGRRDLDVGETTSTPDKRDHELCAGVQGGARRGLQRNLEVSYLAFVTSNERHSMIMLFGVR